MGRSEWGFVAVHDACGRVAFWCKWVGQPLAEQKVLRPTGREGKGAWKGGERGDVYPCFACGRRPRRVSAFTFKLGRPPAEVLARGRRRRRTAREVVERMEREAGARRRSRKETR